MTWKEGLADEEVPLHRGADCLCAQASRAGTKVEEVCRQMGVSQATFFRWKQLYGGLGPSELRRLRQLEEENRKLKKLLAEQMLDAATLREMLAKNF